MRTAFVVCVLLGLAGCTEAATSSPNDDNPKAPGKTHGDGGTSSTQNGGDAAQGENKNEESADGGQAQAPTDAAVVATNNGFPTHWTDGLACATDPKVQVWAYDESTYILRQSLCTSFEGPFVYLLLGQKKALVLDTGTGTVDLAGAVTKIVTEWQTKIAATSIDLVVAHSHGHGDHVGADSQFKTLANTTVVGSSVTAVSQFFGITTWPTQEVTYDLGGRVLDIVPIPGHQAAHIAVYDRRTTVLLTGDTLYPGRLYIDNWAQYQPSVKRLTDFVHAGHPVAWILGGHIELTAAGPDYVNGATKHASEHVLQLEAPILDELNTAVQSMGATPKRDPHPHFIISP